MRPAIVELVLGEGGLQGADASAVAASTVRAVASLLRELEPLVGELAAGALYRRSLHLARASLPRAPDDARAVDDLVAPLQPDIASRAPGEAHEASRALLNALVDLLVSLIGEPLTHKLLTKAWEAPPDAPAAPENPR